MAINILEPFTDSAGRQVAALVEYTNLGTTGYRDLLNNRSLSETVLDVSADGTAIKVDLPVYRGGSPYRSIEGGEYKFISKEEWDRRNKGKRFRSLWLTGDNETTDNPRTGGSTTYSVEVWYVTPEPHSTDDMSDVWAEAWDLISDPNNIGIQGSGHDTIQEENSKSIDPAEDPLGKHGVITLKGNGYQIFNGFKPI